MNCNKCGKEIFIGDYRNIFGRICCNCGHEMEPSKDLPIYKYQEAIGEMRKHYYELIKNKIKRFIWQQENK